MARSVVRLGNDCSRMNDAQKPMEACVWCMPPASAVAVPVRYGNSVNGKASPPKSRARSACCSIPSPLVRPRCGFARLESQTPSPSLHAAPASSAHGDYLCTSTARLAVSARPRPFPCAAGAHSPLMGRTAGAQCPERHFKPGHDQALWGEERLRYLVGPEGAGRADESAPWREVRGSWRRLSPSWRDCGSTPHPSGR